MVPRRAATLNRSSPPIQRARLTFRLMFIGSFLALGLDWTRDAHPLTAHAIWTDMLGYIGSMGYVASSALTLTVLDAWFQSISGIRRLMSGFLPDLLPSADCPSINEICLCNREMDNW
jgi:hypothetical protein